MAGSYELYAEVLRRTALARGGGAGVGAGARAGRASCRTASRRGRPFRDTNALLERLRKKYHKDPPPDKITTGIGLISNIDDKLLGATRRHLRTDFDLVVTAQQVRSYKPDPAHFKECKRRIGTKHEVGAHRHRPGDRRDPLREG